jgi:hypothetical protein
VTAEGREDAGPSYRVGPGSGRRREVRTDGGVWRRDLPERVPLRPATSTGAVAALGPPRGASRGTNSCRGEPQMTPVTADRSPGCPQGQP